MHYEEKGRSQSGYTFRGASSVLNLDLSIRDTRYQVLIDVTTGELLMHSIIITISWFYVTADPPGCKCGFMSEERMRLVLRLDRANEKDTFQSKRQQITPDIRFTCDGMITKWIIGASLVGGSLYPELQVWRNIGNDVYQKMSGTSIAILTGNSIIEYNVSPPIPFQAGDILGVLIPQSTRYGLWYERGDSPTNYYLTADITDTIDLENLSVQTSNGYPLVSVEIG